MRQSNFYSPTQAQDQAPSIYENPKTRISFAQLDNFKELDLHEYLSNINKDLNKHGFQIGETRHQNFFQSRTPNNRSRNSKYENVQSRVFNTSHQANKSRHSQICKHPSVGGSPQKKLDGNSDSSFEKEAQTSNVQPQSRLSNTSSIMWLRRRHKKTANARYLKFADELEQEEEVKDVFEKIDYDLSGSIDVSELHKVCVDNGIQISKIEMREFFDLCQTQSKGYLTFEEFKDLYTNPKADQLFRFFIQRSRKINEELKEQGLKQIYLPFNLSRFLELVSVRSRREVIARRIENQLLKLDQTVNMVKNFVKLFIIDQGAVESVTNDEWSKKIQRAIRQQDLKRMKEEGKKVTTLQSNAIIARKKKKKPVVRLDSSFLDAVTAKHYTRRENKQKKLELEEMSDLENFCVDKAACEDHKKLDSDGTSQPDTLAKNKGVKSQNKADQPIPAIVEEAENENNQTPSTNISKGKVMKPFVNYHLCDNGDNDALSVSQIIAKAKMTAKNRAQIMISQSQANRDQKDNINHYWNNKVQVQYKENNKQNQVQFQKTPSRNFNQQSQQVSRDINSQGQHIVILNDLRRSVPTVLTPQRDSRNYKKYYGGSIGYISGSIAKPSPRKSFPFNENQRTQIDSQFNQTTSAGIITTQDCSQIATKISSTDISETLNSCSNSSEKKIEVAIKQVKQISEFQQSVESSIPQQPSTTKNIVYRKSRNQMSQMTYKPFDTQPSYLKRGQSNSVQRFRGVKQRCPQLVLNSFSNQLKRQNVQYSQEIVALDKFQERQKQYESYLEMMKSQWGANQR